jgi:hypothetical protein
MLLSEHRVGDGLAFYLHMRCFSKLSYNADRTPFPHTSQSCLRRIEGAAVLSEEEILARSAISPWVLDAIRQRDLSKCDVHD